jgi:hypothetical protein
VTCHSGQPVAFNTVRTKGVPLAQVQRPSCFCLPPVMISMVCAIICFAAAVGMSAEVISLSGQVRALTEANVKLVARMNNLEQSQP